MSSFIKPEFFDIFGIIVFGFITVLSIWALKTKKSIPKWALVVLFIIGIAGFLVDSAIVYINYLQ